MCFFCCPESDIAGRTQQPFNLEAWAHSHPQYRSYLERMPRHPAEHWAAFFLCDLFVVVEGACVRIVGDAAHGMAPNLGQGACVAMVNAVVLARTLTGRKGVEEALQRWESRERTCILQTQRMLISLGAVGTRWPHKLLGLRSKLLPLLAKSQGYQATCAARRSPTLGQ